MSGGVEDTAKMFKEKVEHPAHYTDGGIETISFIKAKLGTGFKWYCLGNCLKYLSRAGKKDAMKVDLLKAKKYLEWMIDES